MILVSADNEQARNSILKLRQLPSKHDVFGSFIGFIEWEGSTVDGNWIRGKDMIITQGM